MSAAIPDRENDPPPPERDQAWVTLTDCATLFEAQMLKNRLDAAGFAAFIPDENLMAAEGLALTFGYVRVQVKPSDYRAAREFLASDA